VRLPGSEAPGYRGRMPNVSHLLTAATLATGIGVDGSLDAVRQAQRLLEAHTWSEAVRIENTAAQSRYPHVVHALVFQLDNVLWFYTPTDGTQSLSVYRNHAEADKRGLGPLFLAIDAGFGRWEILPRDYDLSPNQPRLPNGCFIESMALLFEKMADGTRIENPGLLSYYVALPGGIRGHTVLEYTSAGRVQIIDPNRPAYTLRIRAANENNPKSIADRIRGDIAKARYLPLGEFLDRTPMRRYATVPGQPADSHEQEIPERPRLSETAVPGKNGARRTG
jgi:hypothetical protein